MGEEILIERYEGRIDDELKEELKKIEKRKEGKKRERIMIVKEKEQLRNVQGIKKNDIR